MIAIWDFFSTVLIFLSTWWVSKWFYSWFKFFCDIYKFNMNASYLIYTGVSSLRGLKFKYFERSSEILVYNTFTTVRKCRCGRLVIVDCFLICTNCSFVIWKCQSRDPKWIVEVLGWRWVTPLDLEALSRVEFLMGGSVLESLCKISRTSVTFYHVFVISIVLDYWDDDRVIYRDWFSGGHYVPKVRKWQRTASHEWKKRNFMPDKLTISCGHFRRGIFLRSSVCWKTFHILFK